ncbi:MAG: L,D-transpeptidase [Acidobacteria bacterium]|nr:L,D-transpeptidase [Acidobacteriota bacterium]
MKIIIAASLVTLSLVILPGASRSRAKMAGEKQMSPESTSNAETKRTETLTAETVSSVQQSPLKLPLVNPKLVVSKSKRQIFLYANGEIVHTYKIALGTNPVDDKVKQGDRATPEGDFYVCVKNERSNFYLSLGLSYPNSEDAERGLRDKLITRRERDAIMGAIQNKRRPPWNTALGGEIFIHGGGTDGDWTWGCVALANADIKELFDAVPLGTSVRIEH